VRAKSGGEILAPEGYDTPTQYIDARDLADWTLDAADAGLTGIYNVTGPATRQSIGELLDSCRQVSGVDSTVTWVSPEFIEANQITPFLELPLWIPPTMPGLLTVDCSRAIADGLTIRPTEETVRATLQWYTGLTKTRPLRAGLTAEREAELLTAWHQQQPSYSNG
jgi:2'-hydroxyisoflavone reductase